VTSRSTSYQFANNVIVIAGHRAGDTLGFDLLLDVIEQHGPLTVVERAGFKRIRRQS
jgi:hypothetical protein